MNCDNNSININNKEYYFININDLPNIDNCILVKNVKVIKKTNRKCLKVDTLYTDIIKTSSRYNINICIEKTIIDTLKKKFNELLSFDKTKITNKNDVLDNKYKDDIKQTNDYIRLINYLIVYLSDLINDDKDIIPINFFDIENSEEKERFIYLSEYLLKLITLFETVVYNKYFFTEITSLNILKYRFINSFHLLLKENIEKEFDNSKYETDKTDTSISLEIQKKIDENLTNYQNKNDSIYKYGFDWFMNSCWLDSVFWIIFTNINMANYFKNNLIMDDTQINEKPYYFYELNNLINEFYTSNHGMEKRNEFLENISFILFKTIEGDFGTADYAFSILFETFTTIKIYTPFIIKNMKQYYSWTPIDKQFYLVTFLRETLKSDPKFSYEYSIKGSKDGKTLNIAFFKSDDYNDLKNYEPIGILIHTGIHYTAISKGINGIWYYYDDMSEQKVQSMENNIVDWINLSILYWKK